MLRTRGDEVWQDGKMAPRMAAVLRALRKLCSFSYVLFVFFVVLRVRYC